MIATEIEKYIDLHSNADDSILDEIERSTHLYTSQPQMLSGRIQGKFLTLITSLLNAKHVLEIGTFTGYSAVCLARGLNQQEGKVVTLEVNQETAFLIKKHLTLSGLEHCIEHVTGNALDIIPQRDEIWDLVYIDAHKQDYIKYYELVIDRVRDGGLILTDNVLWKGKVTHPPFDKDTTAIDHYNKMLVNDPRVHVLMLPIRDGLSIARKLKSSD